jgi:uncharacterized membrane protein YkoI
MPVSRLFPAVALLGLLAVPALSVLALAADPPGRSCLSKAEQRAEVAAKKAIPLAQAIKSLRDHGHRADVVRARLCRRGETLVYLLTLLGHSGKVIRTDIDAGNGELISGH